MRHPSSSTRLRIAALILLVALMTPGCGSGSAKLSSNPSHEWTWTAGSDSWNQSGVYGSEGSSSPNNSPGARELASGWSDSNGDLWIFGGDIAITGVGIASVGNDLWKYSVANGDWTWMGGSEVPNQPGVYGTIRLASASNMPGAREAATSWRDSFGNFWLFGGIAYDSIGANAADMNDLWEFNPANGTWTWIVGSNLNSLSAAAKGIYGTQGIPSSSNSPGARDSSNAWTDSAGNLWLFGGFGYDSVGNIGALNDLWSFNPATKIWTWVSGSNTAFAPGVYGSIGVAASSNVPQARERAVGWIDSNGNLWLFGGIGWNSSAAGMLNDLWEFSIATNTWTWLSGSSTFDANGVYGTQGVAAPSNVPGARERAIGWGDDNGDFWMYGGLMNGGSQFSDLWEYSVQSNMWTWVGGSTSTDLAAVYGTRGLGSESNFPGSRSDATGWTDTADGFWLFGGQQQDTNGNGLLNDLWLYHP